jgi:hypothetical protein
VSSDTPYVLDANVFIEAARRYYAFDLAPGFWQHLSYFASIGRIHSIDRVRQELERGKDDLADWVRNECFGNGFASTNDAGILQSYSSVMAWVQAHPQFSGGAKANFAAVADGWLVAYAKAKDGIVVTHEVPEPGARNRVKIPNVCQAFNVPFLDTFKMLRALGVKLS